MCRNHDDLVDGSLYEGDFANNKKNGYGRMVYANGKAYCGDWYDDMYDGDGTLELPTGDSYQGQFELGAMSGVGKFLYANGDSYEGMWKNDEAHGVGVFRYSDGEGMIDAVPMTFIKVVSCSYNNPFYTVYEGDFKRFVKHGKGKYTFISSGVYDGDWLDGKQHGEGTYRFPSGEGELTCISISYFLLGANFSCPCSV